MHFIQMLINQNRIDTKSSLKNMKGSLMTFQVSDKLHNFKQIDV